MGGGVKPMREGRFGPRIRSCDPAQAALAAAIFRTICVGTCRALMARG